MTAKRSGCLFVSREVRSVYPWDNDESFVKLTELVVEAIGKLRSDKAAIDITGKCKENKDLNNFVCDKISDADFIISLHKKMERMGIERPPGIIIRKYVEIKGEDNDRKIVDYRLRLYILQSVEERGEEIDREPTALERAKSRIDELRDSPESVQAEAAEAIGVIVDDCKLDEPYVARYVIRAAKEPGEWVQRIERKPRATSASPVGPVPTTWEEAQAQVPGLKKWADVKAENPKRTIFDHLRDPEEGYGRWATKPPGLPLRNLQDIDRSAYWAAYNARRPDKSGVRQDWPDDLHLPTKSETTRSNEAVTLEQAREAGRNASRLYRRATLG